MKNIISSIGIFGTYDPGFNEMYRKMTKAKIMKIYEMVNIDNYSEGIVTPN